MTKHDRLFTLTENDAGLAFSRDTNRFCVVAAGRRSGKTERAKRKGLMRALFAEHKHAGVPRYAWCAPTYAQAKAIFWDDLKAMTAGVRLDQPRESDLMVRLATGAEIWVVGLDKPQRIEGSPWDGFLCDETDDLPSGFWQEHMRPCLSDRRGWAILFGVPNGYGRLYDFSLMAKQYPAEWSFYSWPSSEVLPASEIESARNTMDIRTFRQEYEASFETSSGRVYYAFDRNENVRDAPPGVLASNALRCGMDFNVDPMTAVVFAEDGAATWIIDTISIRSSNTEEMISEIRNRYGQRVTDVYPDPAGRQRKTSSHVGITDHVLLRQAGFNVHTRLMVSVRDGINAVNSRLCAADGTRRLFVAPRCKPLIDALERHTYKQGTSIPDKSDGYDHYCDSLRYPMDYLHSLQPRSSWAQD